MMLNDGQDSGCWLVDGLRWWRGAGILCESRFALRKGARVGGLVGRVSELGIYGIKGWTSIGRWL